MNYSRSISQYLYAQDVATYCTLITARDC